MNLLFLSSQVCLEVTQRGKITPYFYHTVYMSLATMLIQLFHETKSLLETSNWISYKKAYTKDLILCNANAEYKKTLRDHENFRGLE